MEFNSGFKGLRRRKFNVRKSMYRLIRQRILLAWWYYFKLAGQWNNYRFCKHRRLRCLSAGRINSTRELGSRLRNYFASGPTTGNEIGLNFLPGFEVLYFCSSSTNLVYSAMYICHIMKRCQVRYCMFLVVHNGSVWSANEGKLDISVRLQKSM